MLIKSSINLKDEEPMCALDPLLLIPRIEYVEDILSVVKSKNTGFTLVILDMMNFHLINDIYDYSTGDKVLAEFISLLRSHLPTESISLRFRHGDEFLFFLPTLPDKAQNIFTLFNQFCTNHSFLKKPDGSNFLVSFRFATLELSNTKIETDIILKTAESKLREVKGQGSLRKNE
jgi:diguanylate cyclase (GGDEF)-like protein